jgi:hypothetical protein
MPVIPGAREFETAAGRPDVIASASEAIHGAAKK